MAPYRILCRVPKQQNNNAALHDVAHNLKGACIISALSNAAQSFLSFQSPATSAVVRQERSTYRHNSRLDGALRGLRLRHTRFVLCGVCHMCAVRVIATYSCCRGLFGLPLISEGWGLTLYSGARLEKSVIRVAIFISNQSGWEGQIHCSLIYSFWFIRK